MGLATGARPGEVAAMRPTDIDVSGRVWTYKPAAHKTAYRGRARTIYIGPHGQRILRPFLSGRAVDAPLFDPREAVAERAARAKTHRRPDQKPNPRKTVRTHGDCYTTASYRRAVSRACVLSGVPVWHPNRLRHNAATRIRRDCGLEVAAVLLGHSSATLTDHVYAERDTARAIEAVAKIG